MNTMMQQVLLILSYLFWSAIAETKCTATEISLCDTDFNHCVCVPCKICPIGEGLSPQCGSKGVIQAVKCIKCIQGETYSHKNSFESCHPCHICEGEEEQRPCNSTHNTICSTKCAEGYERDTDVTGTCHPIETKNKDKRSKDINTSTPSQVNKKAISLATTQPQNAHDQSNKSGTPTYTIALVAVLIVYIIVTVLLYKKWAQAKKLMRKIFKGGRSKNVHLTEDEIPLRRLDPIPNSFLLKDISPSTESLISAKISKSTKGTKNWRHIGYKYGVSKDDLAIMDQPNVNPGKLLLERIYTEHPEETVCHFVEVLTKMKRNDVIIDIKRECSQANN